MIVQLYGEWVERAQGPKSYAGAVAGCQPHADQVVRTGIFDGKHVRRAIVSRGLALYVDIPDAFFGNRDAVITIDGQRLPAVPELRGERPL
ncbi:hypothetical protein [Streptomyces sp. 058-1L]|uniref:hypothetical protein n=1 Tax=Streptomyces sp. 058-1L TaxID=2789266 RepID=UPI0039818CEF